MKIYFQQSEKLFSTKRKYFFSEPFPNLSLGKAELKHECNDNYCSPCSLSTTNSSVAINRLSINDLMPVGDTSADTYGRRIRRRIV